MISVFVLLSFLFCVQASVPPQSEVETFLSEFETQMTSLARMSSLLAWDYDTNITEATEKANIAASEIVNAFVASQLDIASSSSYFVNADNYDTVVKRKLNILKLYGGEPKNPSERQQKTLLASRMEGIYSSGKVCLPPENVTCFHLDPELTLIMANSTDYDELLWAWTGWRDAVGPPLRPLFSEFVRLANIGARDYGFQDTSDLWLAGYDMPPDDFITEIADLWAQVQPLYEDLHCYVRSKLSEVYGSDRVSLDDPIPAHILGNMWAQEWSDIFHLVVPYPGRKELDVTPEMISQAYNAMRMMGLGESFYTSLGLRSLPDTFWKSSLFTRPPPPREVVCHASAWDLQTTSQQELDLRIKMCTTITQSDLFVIHHELGHLFYDMYYSNQPYLFRGGANDGFHEAIGDTIRLSVSTPQHLYDIGLLPEPIQLSDEVLINYQMMVALDKIAFLPFGYLVDQWRWGVFRGEINPSNYESEWWKLRTKYQGVRAPVSRSEADFDPGAKYHIAANVPYMRYFLAHIYQFQFHQALCQAAESTVPLHLCSIYNSTAAGDKLKAMLSLGTSKPWQEALAAITGSQTMDAEALLTYFAPLRRWLRTYNEENGLNCGWSDQLEQHNYRVFVAVIVTIVLLALMVTCAMILYKRHKRRMKAETNSERYFEFGPQDTSATTKYEDNEESTLVSGDGL